MSKIPPQFWEDPEAFPSDGDAVEHRRHEHDDGHRHWWHRDHWDEH